MGVTTAGLVGVTPAVVIQSVFRSAIFHIHHIVRVQNAHGARDVRLRQANGQYTSSRLDCAAINGGFTLADLFTEQPMPVPAPGACFRRAEYSYRQY